MVIQAEGDEVGCRVWLWRELGCGLWGWEEVGTSEKYFGDKMKGRVCILSFQLD